MEVKITENVKYFPGLSEDDIKWISHAANYIGDLSHENKDELLNDKFEVKLELPNDLKFEPRISGDEIVSIDIVKDYDRI